MMSVSSESMPCTTEDGGAVDGLQVKDLETEEKIGLKKCHLTKTEKKRKKYELKIAHYRANRRQAKLKQKANRERMRELGSGIGTDQEYTCKKERLKQIKVKLEDAFIDGQRICVDLGLESFMSPKECGRLAQQLCRLYGSNRKAKHPAHIYFTSVDKSGFLYKECLRKNAGFEGYMIEMTNKSHLELFKHDEIVYLSPNSSNVLTAIDKDKVYVIGGLVDESVKNNVTQSRADLARIQTARLPITEYMDKSMSGSYNQILTINQVFDILLAYIETQDWTVALPCGIPERNGFIAKAKANKK